MFAQHMVGANCVRPRAFCERPYEITDTLTNFGRKLVFSAEVFVL